MWFFFQFFLLNGNILTNKKDKIYANKYIYTEQPLSLFSWFVFFSSWLPSNAEQFPFTNHNFFLLRHFFLRLHNIRSKCIFIVATSQSVLCSHYSPRGKDTNFDFKKVVVVYFFFLFTVVYNFFFVSSHAELLMIFFSYLVFRLFLYVHFSFFSAL